MLVIHFIPVTVSCRLLVLSKIILKCFSNTAQPLKKNIYKYFSIQISNGKKRSIPLKYFR